MPDPSRWRPRTLETGPWPACAARDESHQPGRVTTDLSVGFVTEKEVEHLQGRRVDPYGGGIVGVSDANGDRFAGVDDEQDAFVVAFWMQERPYRW